MSFPALKDTLNIVVTRKPCGFLFAGTFGEYKLWCKENDVPGQVRIHALVPKGD